jgi:2-dehydropantoate 2-reductase
MPPFYGSGPALILPFVRYVIYGAGAIGGTIGGKLFQHRREAVLICRGAHLEACRTSGLTLKTPDETRTLSVPAVGGPGEIDWREDDVVILAMKSQDTQAALEALRDAAGDVPVVCAQNGVANERMALRVFSRVYAMNVRMPATHLEPGVVVAHSSPVTGVLDLGRYPEGSDAMAEAVAADLAESSFVAQAQAKIMRQKYAKLLMNLANTVQALCGDLAAGEIVRQLREEALAVYAAAGIDCAQPEEFAADSARLTMKPVDGVSHRGGSTWQSMVRGGSLETDYLNGEISLLGALHGVDTPCNRMLQAMAAEATREGRRPGDYTPEQLMARL